MIITKEIAFIDPSITDIDIFLAGLRTDVEPIVLDAEKSAPSQIAKALCGRSALRAVHIVAHGATGAIRFSSGALSAETLNVSTLNSMESPTSSLHGLRFLSN